MAGLALADDGPDAAAPLPAHVQAAAALNNVRFTGTDCMLWGNDYPHDEGTFPNSRRPIEEIRAALEPAKAHHVLCGHAARLYGFDLDHLAATKDVVTRHLH